MNPSAFNQNRSNMATSRRGPQHGFLKRGIEATQCMRHHFFSEVAMLRKIIGVLNCEWDPLRIAVSLHKQGLIGLH